MTSTRFFAAMVGLSVVLPLVGWGGMAGSMVVVVTAMLVCLHEYASMAFPDGTWAAMPWLVASSSALLLGELAGGTVTLASIVAVVMATMMRSTLSPPDPIGLAADGLGRMLVGVMWIGGLFPVLLVLRSWESGFAWVMLAMVISWFGDTGAYFAGRAFGATPLHPKVSPKKSWEGLFGGAAASIAGAVLVKLLGLPRLGLFDALAIGALGSVAGVLGDLCESLLKRSFDVKDSGWIMPGHGGLLDRVDSLLFVSPTIYVYLALAGRIPGG